MTFRWEWIRMKLSRTNWSRAGDALVARLACAHAGGSAVATARAAVQAHRALAVSALVACEAGASASVAAALVLARAHRHAVASGAVGAVMDLEGVGERTDLGRAPVGLSCFQRGDDR